MLKHIGSSDRNLSADGRENKQKTPAKKISNRVLDVFRSFRFHNLKHANKSDVFWILHNWTGLNAIAYWSFLSKNIQRLAQRMSCQTYFLLYDGFCKSPKRFFSSLSKPWNPKKPSGQKREGTTYIRRFVSAESSIHNPTTTLGWGINLLMHMALHWFCDFFRWYSPKLTVLVCYYVGAARQLV